MPVCRCVFRVPAIILGGQIWDVLGKDYGGYTTVYMICPASCIELLLAFPLFVLLCSGVTGSLLTLFFVDSPASACVATATLELKWLL